MPSPDCYFIAQYICEMIETPEIKHSCNPIVPLSWTRIAGVLLNAASSVATFPFEENLLKLGAVSSLL